jgi:hypothetical protein
MWFRCLGDFWGLFCRCREWIEAQIFDDLRVVWGCRIHLIAFPAAKGNHANPQSASRFRLEDPQLKATAAEMAADGPGLFWDWYSTV